MPQFCLANNVRMSLDLIDSKQYFSEQSVVLLNYAGLEDIDINVDSFLHVKYLYLKRNLLIQLPQSIAKLCRLKELHLESNSIESLPDELSSLVFLHVLNVNSNLLTLLPTSVCQLASLTKLQISDNRLTHLPSDLGKLVNLEILEASRNLLTTVPKEIMFCTCLKLLALDRNNLVRLPRQLFILSDLNEVSLAGNNLQYLPLDVVRVPRLRHLIVDDNVDLHYISEVPVDNNILIISKTALHASNLTAEKPAVHGLHIVLRWDLPHVVLPPEFQEVCHYGTHSVPGLQELALRAVFDLMETKPGVKSRCKDLPAELSDLLLCPSAHCHVCARAMFRSAFFAARRHINSAVNCLVVTCSCKCYRKVYEDTRIIFEICFVDECFPGLSGVD